MICPYCHETTAVVAGRCGSCHGVLDTGIQVATGVLTPIPPTGRRFESEAETRLGPPAGPPGPRPSTNGLAESASIGRRSVDTASSARTGLGLQAAHEAGIVHRDLKPANIMVADDQALIMDFGIALSVAGGGGTQLGVVIGTVEYMAPEQARAEAVDHRADIYAFGLILYDMLVGRRAASHTGSTVAELMERMKHAPPSLRKVDVQIPDAVDRIVTCCLQPDPAARYQTMADLTADLDALDAHGHPAVGRTISRKRTRIGPVSLPVASWKWVAAAAAVLLLAGAGGLLVKERAVRGGAGSAAISGQPVTLAILPFRNASGDSSLDWLGPSLAEMLRSELGQSSHLRTVSSGGCSKFSAICGSRPIRASPRPPFGGLRS